MPITMHLDSARGIADLRVFDRVLWEDFHRIAPELEAFIASHEKVRLLEVIDHFEGLDPALLWDGLRFDRRIVPHISHCAIVGDLTWLAPLEHARESLLPMELRLYSRRREAMARMWIERAGMGRTHVLAPTPRSLRRAREGGRA